MGKIYGYVRVSTGEQNIDRQVIALKNFGVAEENIFIDKVSGKNFNRTAYQKLLKKLKSGDTVAIKSIDRLGRNYFEIPTQWKIITQEKSANIVVLDMPILDTRQHKDLLGNLISDIILQILSYVAHAEKEFIKIRQAEGIAAAKLRGVKFGRPKKKIPRKFKEIYLQWKSGKISARQAAKILNVHHSTFLKWTKK